MFATIKRRNHEVKKSIIPVGAKKPAIANQGNEGTKLTYPKIVSLGFEIESFVNRQKQRTPDEKLLRQSLLMKFRPARYEGRIVRQASAERHKSCKFGSSENKCRKNCEAETANTNSPVLYDVFLLTLHSCMGIDDLLSGASMILCTGQLKPV